jgi:hypothetical protein
MGVCDAFLAGLESTVECCFSAHTSSSNIMTLLLGVCQELVLAVGLISAS